MLSSSVPIYLLLLSVENINHRLYGCLWHDQSSTSSSPPAESTAAMQQSRFQGHIAVTGIYSLLLLMLQSVMLKSAYICGEKLRQQTAADADTFHLSPLQLHPVLLSLWFIECEICAAQSGLYFSLHYASPRLLEDKSSQVNKCVQDVQQLRI